MAQRALPAGAARRRAFFGLMDATGWPWAIVRGLFWFVLMLLLLGYLPDRAYYFTVSPTISVGANVFSPINLCAPGNGGLPCPAPRGAIVPWQPSPAELALPAAVQGASVVQSGSNLYLTGGSIDGRATDQVFTTQVNGEGNFSTFQPGPKLPAPRTDAAVVSLGGVPYLIGGTDASGAETDTVYVGVLEEGRLTSWEAPEELRLPQPVSGTAAVAATDSIWVLGGRSGGQLSNATFRARLNEAGTSLEAWEPQTALPMPEPRANGVGVLAGRFIYVIGGEGPQGATRNIMRLALTGESDPARTAGGAAYEGWATPQTDSEQLPEPRMRASGWGANGAVYVVGGLGADGAPVQTSYWATPDAATGTIGGWKHLDDSDLPEPRVGGAAAVVGSHAFVFGGQGPQGPANTTLRANLSPASPFFQLGLFGATVPGLGVKGDVGQQLGALNAAGVGTVNFIILILIGLAFSHRTASKRVMERLTRGRYRAPREDEYFG